MPHRLAGLALVVGALLVPASAALAAPVTVNLRVEGATQTLFEGPVTTDAMPALTTTSSGGPHPCDVGENSIPATAVRAANATTALASAAPSIAGGWDAAWFDPPLNDFSVTRVGPDAQTATAFWGLAMNFASASAGGCHTAVNPGDQVLWAYDFFSKTHILRLTGPATAAVGATVTVNVVDGQNGTPVAGATVGGATTDAAGNARVTFGQAGLQRLKAEEPSSVRSNALVVSVGAAGTAAPAQGVAGAIVDRTAPRARLLSPRSGHVYRYTRFSPRLFHIVVAESGSGLKTVKIRLTRRVGKRCFSYSGKRERFIGAKCGGGFFFTVDSKADFTYLLPKRLPRGHYVLDVSATDNAANRDSLGQRGRNRSVFDVR